MYQIKCFPSSSYIVCWYLVVKYHHEVDRRKFNFFNKRHQKFTTHNINAHHHSTHTNVSKLSEIVLGVNHANMRSTPEGLCCSPTFICVYILLFLVMTFIWFLYLLSAASKNARTFSIITTTQHINIIKHERESARWFIFGRMYIQKDLSQQRIARSFQVIKVCECFLLQVDIK